MTYMDPNDPTRVPTDEPVRRPTVFPTVAAYRSGAFR